MSTRAAVIDPDAIRENLVAQVTGTVRWRESVAYMSAARRDALRRSRRRQGARRPRQAHRGGRDGDQRRRAGRRRRLQDVSAQARARSKGEARVRSDRKDGARHRRFGRPRRRDRARAARQGATVALSGTRRDALEALAGELGERAHVLPCDLSDPARSKRSFRPPRRRWARSTSSSTTPASRATISSCA